VSWLDRIFGYDDPQEADKTERPPAESSVTVSQKREDRPRFERVYKSRVDERCMVTVRCYTFLGRNSTGELTQPNGRWVYFDPDAIAEKIIDPILVPKVQAIVDHIKAMDRDFVQSDPAEFIDKSGRVWKRQL
jgi:hypothetical protein